MVVFIGIVTKIDMYSNWTSLILIVSFQNKNI